MHKVDAEKRYNVTYLYEDNSIRVEKAMLISIEANWLVIKDSNGNKLIISGSNLIEMEEAQTA